MNPKQTAFNSLHPPVIAGASRVGRVEGFLHPMTELRKQMEEGISADEILMALRKIVIDQVVNDRARSVERQHYGYPEPEEATPRELAEFGAALVKAITGASHEIY